MHPWLQLTDGHWINIGAAIDVQIMPLDHEEDESVTSRVRIVWPAINEKLQVLDGIHDNLDADIILRWLGAHSDTAFS